MQKITAECLSDSTENHTFAQHDYNTAILAASDAMHLTENDQEQKLLLARCGRWMPLSVVDKQTSIEYNMLAGHDMISKILDGQPQGEFQIPHAAPQASGSSSQGPQLKYSSIFNHICMHGPLKNIFRSHTYKEMDNSTSEFLNEDWQLCPQMRYVASMMFSGS